MLDKEMGKRYFIGCWMILMGLAGWGQHSLRAQTTSSGIQMPQLPYALNALAPVVSEETMNYHYGKHLKAYIDKLNVLIVGTPFEKSDLETIVKYSTGPIYDNGAQALNHMIYFNTFSPNARQQPTGALLETIEEKWGSFENFKEEFSNAAVTLFGSGWVWLAKDDQGELFIFQENNGGNPLSRGFIPLLGFDVWEHAYYLDYQNRRPEHIKNLWTIVDWANVEKRY